MKHHTHFLLSLVAAPHSNAACKYQIHRFMHYPDYGYLAVVIDRFMHHTSPSNHQTDRTERRKRMEMEEFRDIFLCQDSVSHALAPAACRLPCSDCKEALERGSSHFSSCDNIVRE
jgi:uncharacterized protein (DUF1919 family)